MKLVFSTLREFFIYAQKDIDSWSQFISLQEAQDILNISRQRLLKMVDTSDLDACIIQSHSKPENQKTAQIFVKKNQVLLRTSIAGNPRNHFLNRVLYGDDKANEEFCDSSSYTLFTGAKYLRQFVTSEDTCTNAAKEIPEDSIDKLKNWLDKLEQPLDKPMTISVKGMFLQASLLSKGVWEEKHQTDPLFTQNNTKSKEMSDLQFWLAKGFSEWAPSLDINPPILSFIDNTAEYPYLSCQIGSFDEGFSIPLLISSERKEVIELIAELSSQQPAFYAKVRGTLMHKNHLPPDETHLLNNSTYDYCIKILADERQHKIIPIRQTNHERQIYGSYLWVCLGNVTQKPTFSNTYWVFEHADLSSTESIKYNMDSLEHKIHYIREQNKQLNLSILHKSIPLISGESAYEADIFYDLLLNNLAKRYKSKE